MPKAYVRRPIRNQKPIFRRIYRRPTPLRQFAHTKTVAAPAGTARVQGYIF